MTQSASDDRAARIRAAQLGAIADRLSARALQVTTPVYRTQRGLPVSEGTAVRLALGDIRFLLTAAHVLEGLREGGLAAEADTALAPIGGDITYLYTAPERTDHEDLVDIRIVRLSGDAWTSVPLSAFLTWAELDLDPPTPERHAFGLLGYPFTLQRGSLKGSQMEARAYGVAGLECPASVYQSLGADPNLTLLIGFDKRHTWGREGQVTAPDLYGASGCGLWRFGRRLRDVRSPPKLSAIGVRWERGKLKHIRGTRLRPIVVAIGQRYGDARAIMERYLNGAV